MVKLADLTTLFEDHVASSSEKQEHLARQIGEHAWRFDMGTGMLTFTRDEDVRETQVQLLGTQSFQSGTWLWAWANEESHIPADLLGAADHLKEVGARDRIASFTTPELAIDEDEGHRLAMIASGMLAMPGYYRGPFGAGAAFFLIQEADWAFEQAPNRALRIATFFPEVISRWELRDHARALAGHVRYHGGEIVARDASSLTARLGGGDELIAAFDQQGRLIKLDAKAGKHH